MEDNLFIYGLIIIVFLILREVFTWYIKQNKIVQQNDEIIRLLKKLANEYDEPPKTLFQKWTNRN